MKDNLYFTHYPFPYPIEVFVLTQEEENFSTKFAPFINEGNVIRMLDEINRAEIDIAGNANGRIVLFDLAIKITILIKR